VRLCSCRGGGYVGIVRASEKGEESISTEDLTSEAQIIQAILKYNEEVSEQEKESEEKEESEDNKDEESEKEKEKKPEEQPTLLEGQKGRESCSGLVLRVIL